MQPMLGPCRWPEQYFCGAGELEMVRPGLLDTIHTSNQQISERWHSRDFVEDLRTAAFMLAIDKIATCYRAKGI
jgi:glutamate dehydrogenase (NAD(P)+)